jgi:hypothetical protein
VARELQLDPERLSVDMLNVMADESVFQRFDRFNEKYNPAGKFVFALVVHT